MTASGMHPWDLFFDFDHPTFQCLPNTQQRLLTVPFSSCYTHIGSFPYSLSIPFFWHRESRVQSQPWYFSCLRRVSFLFVACLLNFLLAILSTVQAIQITKPLITRPAPFQG
jgi:hypothetical protein